MKICHYVFIVVLWHFCLGQDTIESCYSQSCNISDPNYSLYNALGDNCTYNKPRARFLWYLSSNATRELRLDAKVSTSLDASKPVILLINGIGEPIRSVYDYTNQIKDSYFKANITNVTIIKVDYSGSVPHSPLFAYPKNHCGLLKVGDEISEFLYNLNTKYGFSIQNMHLIGFSFGAHLAGIAGYRLKRNSNIDLGRITGLDPLGAGYLCVTCDSLKLDKTDAKFVDVIHTNPGHIGIAGSVGDEDFYVNPPYPIQPGCGNYDHPGCLYWKISGCVDEKEKRMCFLCMHGTCNGTVTSDECSSARSNALYAESILHNDFIASSCFSYLQGDGCNPIDYTYMGEQATPAKYDNYYISTTPKPPYTRTLEVVIILVVKCIFVLLSNKYAQGLHLLTRYFSKLITANCCFNNVYYHWLRFLMVNERWVH